MIKKILLSTFILMATLNWVQAQNYPVFLENFTKNNVGDTLSLHHNWTQCSIGANQITLNPGNFEYPSTTLNATYDPDPTITTSQNAYNCLYFDSTYAGTSYGGYCNTFSPMNHGRVYMAFVYKGDSIHRTNTVGDYFITMGSGTSANAARVLVRYSNNLVQFGVKKESGTNTAVWGTNTYSDTMTHLIVLVYEYNPGANDDKVMLYVDPKIPGPEPMTPTAMAPTSDPDFVGAISNLFIRINMSVANAPCAYIDNIMIDSTWANVGGLPPCNASFTSTTSGLTATFNNTSTGGFQSYLFDYGDASPPSSNSTYTYATGGTYNVCLTTYTDAGANNPCDTICHSITVTSIGINDVKNDFNASVFYTNDKPTLKVTSSNNLSATITLINALGQVVETVYNGNLSVGDKTFTPSIHQSGLYFYQIITAKGTKTLKAFVKN